MGRALDARDEEGIGVAVSGGMRRLLVIVFISVIALSGCGAVAGQAAESAVEEGTEQIAQREQRAQIASVLGDADIQRATGELVASVLDAAFQELTREERGAALEEALARYTGVVGEELGASVTEAVLRQMEGVLDAPAAERLEAISASMSAGIAEGLSRGLRDEVGPALREVIREDVAVAIEEALDERLEAALGRAARTMAREAVIGATEAMAEGQEGRRGGGVRSDLRGLFEQGEDVAQWGTAAVLLLVLFAVLAIGALAYWAWRSRRDARRNREALSTMVGAIERVEDREWSPELLEILRDAYRGREGSDLVRSLLREDPSLKRRVREAADRAGIKPPTESPAE